MAKIEDLIAQISDERLRKGIAEEVKSLKRTKKFGLVFEEHLPETVRLPRLPVKPGELVALKRESGSQRWRVKIIHKGVATCDQAVEGYPDAAERNKEFKVTDLVVVRSFGEPIYPALVPVDRIERGGPDKPWHLLINADNFHALQLLLYCYEGKVDVIYIDPPYNTGARDWKYNNDYVDKTDSFRHSKWLSMMKKRLLLARRLLKSDGVLIVTIDENEHGHLLGLLEDVFPNRENTSVSIVHNPRGVQGDNFSYTHEYAVFTVQAGNKVIAERRLPPEEQESAPLRNWGTESLRSDAKNCFYPVLVRDGAIAGFGDVAPDDYHPGGRNTFGADGCVEIWPVDAKGIERKWRYARQSVEQIRAQLLVCDTDAGLDVELRKERGRYKTVWRDKKYDASTHGTQLVRKIVGRAFPYPKSVYAVLECLEAATTAKPDALIMDFFSGSGTTYHATCLLNAADQGRRRSVLVTNNEVTEDIAKNLATRGHYLGDAEYEQHGVAESIAWPRCKFCTAGRRDDKTALVGKYLNGGTLAAGFEENIEFCRLDFLEPSEVARGDAFQAILPVLWLMAGCRGKREDSKGSQDWFFPKQSPFAVLIREKAFRAFRSELEKRPDIEWVFLVTDSEENFAAMRRVLSRKLQCVQLYKNYLENFRLNTPEALTGGGV